MDGGPNCPFCKNQEEDWNGDHQKQLQQQPTAPTKDPDDPSTVPQDPELSETPEFPEIQLADT